MWVIVVLLLIGGTIVCVRLFRNGALEEVEPEASESSAPEVDQQPAPAVRTRARATQRPAAATSASASPPVTVSDTAPRRGRGKAAAAPSSAWPGGDCPSCGNPTVPAAKFCGECGHRLTT
jgi:hypothetical protein